jgi:hypothetical protein
MLFFDIFPVVVRKWAYKVAGGILQGRKHTIIGLLREYCAPNSKNRGLMTCTL